VYIYLCMHMHIRILISTVENMHYVGAS